MVRLSVFTVASVRILPSAHSRARREVLLCSCKEVPEKHARLPRPRPAVRAGVSLAPRVFAGGAETRCAFGFAQTVSASLPAKTLSTRRDDNGGEGPNNGCPSGVAHGWRLGLRTSLARAAFGHGVPRPQAGARGRMPVSAANRIRVAPTSERCVSLRSTAPYEGQFGCRRGDTFCFDLHSPRMKPLAEGFSGRKRGADCLSEAKGVASFSAAGPRALEQGPRAESGCASTGILLGKQESTSGCAAETALGSMRTEGT